MYRLRDCAAERIRAHLQQRMALLRQPRTNIHIIQRGELLRHKELYLFLTDQAPACALAIKEEYTRIISTVYASLFKAYHTQLIGMMAEATSAQQKHQQGHAEAAGVFPEAAQDMESDDPVAAAGGKVRRPRLGAPEALRGTLPYAAFAGSSCYSDGVP